MFAVVEFMGTNGDSSHEISIVPLIWLQKNDTKCYWPIKTNNIAFETFVKIQTPFKRSWPLYKIYEVHFKTASYEEAELHLKLLINNSEENSTDQSNRSLLSQKQPIDSCPSSSEGSDSDLEPQIKRICNNGPGTKCSTNTKSDNVLTLTSTVVPPSQTEPFVVTVPGSSRSFASLTTATASPCTSSFSSTKADSD
nr:PREDICTED: uncharacterized protein LOC103313249 [Tribolium castaneum]|eukprot:XP_015840166.1 PREDICTED: uncharacterized protein LOC103313249 [Tribolium castaneum]